MFAISPCNAAIMVIEAACMAGINFMVALYGCIEISKWYDNKPNPTLNDKYEYVYYRAGMAMGSKGVIEKDYFEPSYECSHPIISSRYHDGRGLVK